MEKQEDKKLNLWGAADIGEAWMAMVPNTYFSIFLTDIAMLPVGLMGIVMTITSVFDFIDAPLAGGIVASGKPGKWGRHRSWYVRMPLIITAAFTLVFIPIGNPVLAAVIITLAYCIAKGTYNISWAANLSIINVIAQNDEQKTKLSSQRMIGFNIGRVASNYLAPLVAAFFAAKIGERYSYAPIMLIGGVILCIGYAICFKISEPYESKLVDTKVDLEDEKGASLKDMFNALVKNPQLLVTVLVDLTSNMGSFVMPALATYYYKYVAEDTVLMATHMLLIGFGGLAGSLFIRAVGKKIKSHRTYLCISYLLIATCIFSCRLFAYKPILFMIVNVISQIIVGTTQPLEIQLYMDNVVYEEYKTGVNSNAFIMGLVNLPNKFATLLKSILIPFVLAQAGYVAGGAITPALKQGIINAYTIIPTCIPLLGFVLLAFCYKLSRERVAEMKAEIERRHNAEKAE